MIPGKGKFATPGGTPDLFACGDEVRLYSAFGMFMKSAGPPEAGRRYKSGINVDKHDHRG